MTLTRFEQTDGWADRVIPITPTLFKRGWVIITAFGRHKVKFNSDCNIYDEYQILYYFSLRKYEEQRCIYVTLCH